MELHEKIKDVRQSKNLSQKQVADKLGIAQPNYGLWESGKTNLTKGKLIKLADIFGVPLEKLLEDEPSEAGKVGESVEVELLKTENKLLKEKIETLLQDNIKSIKLIEANENTIKMTRTSIENFLIELVFHLISEREYATNSINDLLSFFIMNQRLFFFFQKIIDNLSLFRGYKGRNFFLEKMIDVHLNRVSKDLQLKDIEGEIAYHEGMLEMVDTRTYFFWDDPEKPETVEETIEKVKDRERLIISKLKQLEYQKKLKNKE